MGVEAPIPISVKLGDFNGIFRRIVNAAEHPHLSIPETEAGKNRKHYNKLIGRSLMCVSGISIFRLTSLKNLSLLSCLKFGWCDLSLAACSLFWFRCSFWFYNDFPLITLGCHATELIPIGVFHLACFVSPAFVVEGLFLNPLFARVLISCLVDCSWSWNLGIK